MGIIILALIFVADGVFSIYLSKNKRTFFDNFFNVAHTTSGIISKFEWHFGLMRVYRYPVITIGANTDSSNELVFRSSVKRSFAKSMKNQPVTVYYSEENGNTTFAPAYYKDLYVKHYHYDILRGLSIIACGLVLLVSHFI